LLLMPNFNIISKAAETTKIFNGRMPSPPGKQ
jgi:hypothetical protein